MTGDLGRPTKGSCRRSEARLPRAWLSLAAGFCALAGIGGFVLGRWHADAPQGAPWAASGAAASSPAGVASPLPVRGREDAAAAPHPNASLQVAAPLLSLSDIRDADMLVVSRPVLRRVYEDALDPRRQFLGARLADLLELDSEQLPQVNAQLRQCVAALQQAELDGVAFTSREGQSVAVTVSAFPDEARRIVAAFEHALGEVLTDYQQALWRELKLSTSLTSLGAGFTERTYRIQPGVTAAGEDGFRVTIDTRLPDGAIERHSTELHREDFQPSFGYLLVAGSRARP